ncbi:MAG: hypothetical protein DMF56_24560 [Acidobacteria bacterium]|nr:MAG: hypothetical protein DMF56_24560 [Acidobacteriota bacterium]
MNTNGREIGRRQFLVVSSTCVLAAATMGPKLFGAEAGASPKRLAVAFAALDDATVVDAANIPAGDGGFIGRGARVTVSGTSGHSADAAGRRAVELLTHFSYMDGAERREAPFRAWGCNRVQGCQGSPVSFNVPVDEVHQIRFSVGAESGALDARATSRRDAMTGAAVGDSQALPLTLSLLSEGDSLKLVRGYYIVVPLFENDSVPRWSGWNLDRVDGRMALVDSNGVTAPFEHIVLRIDYAS